MQFPAQDDSASAWGFGALSGSGRGVGDGPGNGSWGGVLIFLTFSVTPESLAVRGQDPSYFLPFSRHQGEWLYPAAGGRV